MKVVLRADASLKIGTGHVMRCLTLADRLRDKGFECEFICREHPGNLIEHIRTKGYRVYALPYEEQKDWVLPSGDINKNTNALSHSDWLGATQECDVAECSAILSIWQPDWLIVDHYALDARWEGALRGCCRRLMVIDDLADRYHLCDVLLDQTFGRIPEDYAFSVPANCILLCGSEYALLRPEFAALRPYSLRRRRRPRLEHILVTMGGVDQCNATQRVLEALKSSDLPADFRVTVVMGISAPWLGDIIQLAEQMPIHTAVKVDVQDMAELMTDSDLAIGAAGTTTWERCCLGLPTIMFVLAENQRYIARALYESGAASLTESAAFEVPSIVKRFLLGPHLLAEMSTSAARLADGLGAVRVASNLKI